MNVKAMAMVTVAGLAVAAAGCGGLADPPVATSVRYASDGTLVVFAGSVIDSYGPDLARKAHIPVVTCSGPLFSLSDDGSVAAVACSISGNRVQLFHLSSAGGTPMTNLGKSPAGAFSYAPQGLALSPAGDLLFAIAGVGGQGDTSGVFDTSTGARLWTIEAAYGVRAFFSPDESALYVLGASPVYGGGLQGFDSRTGTVGLNAPLADSVQAFGGMSDPNTLIGVAVSTDPVTYAESTEIDLISTADGSRTGQVVLPANTEFSGNVVQPSAFHCAPAAGFCVMPVVEFDSNTHTSIVANSVQVWALDGSLVQSIDNVSGDVAISPDGQYVAAIYDGDVTVYRVSDGSQVKFLPYRNQVL
jgi:WD40 repeat protein